VVSAWMSAEEAFGTAALSGNPDEPSLAATTVASQLDWSRALLVRMRADGQVARGPVIYGHPRVTMLRNDLATVESCADDAEIVVSATSGQAVPGIPGQVDFELFSSTMHRTGGVWELETQSVGVGQCHAP
jgi:hypothetical protein